MTITLYNTATRRKEAFEPLEADNVRMYVCGPTVYDRAHLGNARPVLVFDVLYRLLRHTYGADHVTYVRNFTDVDDKINATALARKEAGAPGTMEELISERTEETIAWYHADMDALGAMRPDHAPRATQYIDDMKAMIVDLIDKGFAYSVATQTGHNSGAQYVYLDSARVPSHTFLSVDAFEGKSDTSRYGALSGRSVDDMIAGSRAETGEGKRNPMDSVLWKPSTLDQPGWESPWGFGRPGWHIECSAMSRKLLGKAFDIHGGGLDLLFPHHENERAQCLACDGDDASARYWMHNEMLQVEGKKMSKSMGNFFTVRDLLAQGVPGEVIRFVMLSTHYRKPMDWTEKKRAVAEATLRGWRDVCAQVAPGEVDPTVLSALSDDLNTHGAITQLHALAGHAVQGDTHAARTLKASAALLGLLGDDLGDWASSDGLEAMAEKLLLLRNAAMANKDFTLVDDMKRALAAAGVEIRMSKDKVDLVPAAGFDPAKLEGLE